MKNIVTILITALLFIYTPVLQAQIHKDTDVDEFIDDGDGKPIDIGDIIAGNPCNNVECENIPNIRFQFTGGSLFDGAVQNEINIRRAAEREANRWYDKQISIAKSFIDRKYGKNFVSFNAAKNELFNETEIPAIIRLTDGVRREKSRSKGRRTAARLKHLDQFRSLRVRKQEINRGLINTNYPYKKVNGTSLASLKTNADITREYNKLVTVFRDNKWREFKDEHIINLTRIPLIEEMAKLKNGYFSSLNKWNRLDYLQFLIFFEEFKKQSTPPYALNPELSRIFNSYVDKIEFSTQPRVDAFIAANQNKELSIFHPDYWIKLVNNTQTWIPSDVRILKAKAAHQGLMDRELDRLAGAPLNATHDVDKLIGKMSIRDPYQVQWLNDHSHKVPEFRKRIDEAIKKDNEGEFGNNVGDGIDIIVSGDSFHYNFTISSIEGEINRGIAAATLIYELGITDANRKKWLYENINQAKRVLSFYERNISNGFTNGNLKKVIDILRRNISEDEKVKAFSELFDLIEPVVNSTQIIPYKDRMQAMAAFLQQRGDSDAREFGASVQRMLPKLNEFTVGEVKSLYKVVDREYKNLKFKYRDILFLTTVNSFKPVVQVALVAVGGRAAYWILKSLPRAHISAELSAVLARLSALFTPAMSEAYKALMHASKYGIHTYNELDVKFSALGIIRSTNKIQFHHLIEQRFQNIPGVREWLGANTNDWKCIAVSVIRGAGNEHNNLFTQPWRRAIAYGTNPNVVGWTGKNLGNATLEDIKLAARQIYANYPEILRALGLN